MKVVINRCFGDFGISNEALLELIKRNAKCVKQYTVDKYTSDKNKLQKELIPFVDGFQQHQYLRFLYKDGIIYENDDRDKKTRTDPDLIKIVEMMNEKSFGDCAKLEIVEIPDDIEWFIDEYDGNEKICENHRTW